MKPSALDPMQLAVRPSESGLSFTMNCKSPPQAIQGHVGMEMKHVGIGKSY
jgi:hypothetical protein